jgi:catechol 2,3-dioxygenase-like lactoylglutathione lyase family enzyme
MTRLQHVNIVVPSGRTDDVVPFYVGVLGLTRVPKPPEAGSPLGAWLDVCPGMQVHISERDGAIHRDQHFALVVDDFDGVASRVADAGREWRDAASMYGARRAFIRDPVGNLVEVVEDAGGFAAG